MVMPTALPQGSRLNPRNTFEVCEGMSLAQAVANADALGGDWTILLYPGTYNEGDITPNGGANITIKGVGVERAVIAPVAVPAVAVIVSGFNLALENLIVTAPSNARPALRVTGGACLVTSSSLIGVGIGDSIQQVAGALTLDACRVSADIDLSTAACTLNINYSLLEGPIDTAGFLAHILTLIGCDFNAQGLASAATGATTLALEGCTHVGTITNAGTGAFTIRASDVATATASSTGTITIIGGYLNACGGATAAVLWRTGPLRYEVLPNMNIQDSLTAGAGGEVIIHAGAYAPTTNLTVAANTLVRGEGKATIITPTGAAVANGIVLNGNNITLRDMKVILAAGAGAPTTRPNVVYANTKTLLWLENLWLVGDTTVGDDGASSRQNGVCFITCTYSKIVNCQIQTNRWTGILLYTNSDYNTVIGNTCQGNIKFGIDVEDAHNNIVTGNTCQGNNRGIGLFYSSNDTVTGNYCQGNVDVGIFMFTSLRETVTGNTCQGNGSHNIQVFRCSYCVITGNSCNGSTAQDGINVAGDGTGNADYNTITGNVCTLNAGNGIEIAGGANANKNIIVANSLLGNTGANLVDSGTNTEVGHNITV